MTGVETPTMSPRIDVDRCDILRQDQKQHQQARRRLQFTPLGLAQHHGVLGSAPALDVGEAKHCLWERRREGPGVLPNGWFKRESPMKNMDDLGVHPIFKKPR